LYPEKLPDIYIHYSEHCSFLVLGTRTWTRKEAGAAATTTTDDKTPCDSTTEEKDKSLAPESEPPRQLRPIPRKDYTDELLDDEDYYSEYNGLEYTRHNYL
jgi:hypothetical protein